MSLLSNFTPRMSRFGLARSAVMVKRIHHHQPSHGSTVQHLSRQNRREEGPELWPPRLVREVYCGRSVTQLWLQPYMLPQLRGTIGTPASVAPLFPSSSASMAQPYPMVVRTPKISRWPPSAFRFRVSLSEDTGRWQAGPRALRAAILGSLVRGCLLVIRS